MTDYSELVNDLREYLTTRQISDLLEAQAKESAAFQDTVFKSISFWAHIHQKQERRIAELEAALKDATVHLVAAVSLLESGGKKAAPSNKMFEQMIADYKNGVERARAALKGEK